MKRFTNRVGKVERQAYPVCKAGNPIEFSLLCKFLSPAGWPRARTDCNTSSRSYRCCFSTQCRFSTGTSPATVTCTMRIVPMVLPMWLHQIQGRTLY